MKYLTPQCLLGVAVAALSAKREAAGDHAGAIAFAVTAGFACGMVVAQLMVRHMVIRLHSDQPEKTNE